MSVKATNDALSALHSQLAEVLKEAMQSEEGRTPSMLNTVRQFLKDNGIEASPTDSSPLSGLAVEVAGLTYDKEGNPVFN